MTHIKDFIGWHNFKSRIDQSYNPPTFKEREIWWCCIGVNIGNEEDGKNEKYNRPVLVIRKFNQNLFWGVPLTTQLKENKFYIPFRFKEREQCAMITHLRLYDSKRLTHLMGTLGPTEFEKIKSELKNLL